MWGGFCLSFVSEKNESCEEFWFVCERSTGVLRVCMVSGLFLGVSYFGQRV